MSLLSKDSTQAVARVPIPASAPAPVAPAAQAPAYTVNGVPQDPLKVDLPRKRSLAGDELRQFESCVAQLTALL
ncbi:hypothetical protein [Paraburkholderia tuberum]|uniref:hypothetical protein n=1 Tax=Paraburkholderia tuberum TaxID=157910 RepID=UPI001590E09B|nr:hypothetical protein [Paraburkholderia tuberum]